MVALTVDLIWGFGSGIFVGAITSGVAVIFPYLQLLYIIIGLISGLVFFPICPISCLGGYLGSMGIISLLGGVGMFLFSIIFSLVGGSIFWIPIDLLLSPLPIYLLCSPISGTLDLINILKIGLNSLLNLLSLG